MADLEVHQFPCRSDNFGVLVHDPDTGRTAAIDAPETQPILDALEEKGWTLTDIFTTHHHPDHVAGNDDLRKRFDVTITGPAKEADRIPGIDETVGGGDSFEWAGRTVEVIDTPGHTNGQIAYHIPSDELLFSADALFVMGCGRLFEGTPEDMHGSLQRLAALPEDTRVYVGHEYTLSNARFAVTVDPANMELAERLLVIDAMRTNGEPTSPTTIKRELLTNPFLRVGDEGIRKALGMADASDVEVFAELRKRKDAA